MGQHLGVAKAATMLGVSRHELQRMIRIGDLHTFEGRLDLDELRQHFPLMALDEEPMLERVTLIRQTAFGRRVKERLLPDPDELSTKLRRKMADLDVARAQAANYRAILEELCKLLGQMRQDGDEETCRVVERVNQWLLDRFKA